MNFEWDEEKAKINLRKHSISFEEAVTVFDDPLTITFNDTLHSTQEYRFITIDYSNLQQLLVVSTDRENITRIVSARNATTKERRIYERQF